MRERHLVRHDWPPIAQEASSMTGPDQIIDILRKAYQIEVDGYTFYSMTADRADKPAVQELFGKLAQDEMQHQAFLRTAGKNYHDKGVEAFSMGIVLPDLRAFSNKVFTDRFREQAEGAAFEMAALSVGMTLEKNAVAYFSEAVRNAPEAEVRQFYQFLADWEQQHLNALQSLSETIRGDFWEKSGFSPF
jgi:rubrerythrin